MKQSIVYDPTLFFAIALLLSTTMFGLAAYASYMPTLDYLLFPFIMVGMGSPTIAVLAMILCSRQRKLLWDNFLQKLRPRLIKVHFMPAIILFMPILILLAIAISLVFDGSIDQFSLHTPGSKDLQGVTLLTIIPLVLFSCSLEELGWRGYGIDSLMSTFNLWKTSLLFAVLWCFWHVPAFFVKNGYFQQEVWGLGVFYVAVYLLSLFPISLIMNWLYINNNRSILTAILFHTSMNLAYGLFPIQPYTKVIIMVLLFIAAGIIVHRDRRLFCYTS